MSKIKEIIAELAKEEGITEFKATKVVENVFNYMKNSMGKLESKEYYIQKFGKFNIIEKRYDKIINKIKKDSIDNVDTDKTTN